jgi:sulfotransferase
MKEYYFISGLPRSGSTLLSSILLQNPDFHADISTPIELFVQTSIDILTANEMNTSILEEQRKNIMYGIFDGYYKNIKKSTIFDTSRSWTGKTSFLKSLFPYTKILCPVRDITAILNSFELIKSKNPFHANTISNEKSNVFLRCGELLTQPDGLITEPLNYLKEGYALNPQMIMFIEYDKMCKNPEKMMRDVYNFLEKPYYPHDFTNLNYSNKQFDLNCNARDLHTVKKTVKYTPQSYILPQEIVKEYSSKKFEFWKDHKNLNYE